MKKFTTLVFVLALFSFASHGSLNTAIPPTEPLYEIGYGVKVSYQELITMTPKKYKQYTGHRLGVVKSIALKAVHKKMAKNSYFDGDKSQVTALILVVLVGILGIHRFYLGYTWQGIVQLLTLGVFGIWTLIDLIRIITGDLKPKNGEYNPTL